ncbi:MAG: hypothetical protein JWO45_334 [Spartobacteria bacterium]|nr:hypothetical protein [Spartobacteria bacterium]
MVSSLPRVYPLLGLFSGYALVMLFNPVRLALRDGFRCLMRFPRIWVTFVLFGFAYSVFQFATFSPIQSAADLDFTQVTSLPSWHWPRLVEVWQQAPLPALENIAGIFDNATTTYPLSVIAAVLIILNWRGLHGALFSALRKRYRFFGLLIYLIVLISALATLLKPIVFWRLPEWGGLVPAAGLLRISATVDAIAFIFEYLFGVYVQVYLIVVCFAWIRGLSFEEGALFRFAMRRFSFVLKWAGIVVLVSTLVVRAPLLLAYFMNVPHVLDYLPLQRLAMCILVISFASVQVSLALHNESLPEAVRAHRRFLRRNWGRYGWFVLICALHFFFIMACDAIARGAIADRLVALIIWKCFFVTVRGFITGWLLASWVCLFRQYESGRVSQESWIQY